MQGFFYKIYMLVYKYRSGNSNDLTALKRNYFWAPDANNLNDPCETLLLSDKIIQQADVISRVFNKNAVAYNNFLAAEEKFKENIKNVGIYSLSQTYNHELLWAHYANSHKGYCVEYELDLLLDNTKFRNGYHFPILYKKTPPLYDNGHINNIEVMVKEIVGVKSECWKYEEEYRITTDLSGPHIYDYKALKSIYFGLRMSDLQKRRIMSCLKGRGVKYYQMQQISKTYKFSAIEVPDYYGFEETYMNNIPITVTKDKMVKFNITKRTNCAFLRMGEISIELDKSISEREIKWLANKMLKEFFHKYNKVIMFYYIKDQKDTTCAWAYSHFIKGQLDISINSFLDQ